MKHLDFTKIAANVRKRIVNEEEAFVGTGNETDDFTIVQINEHARVNPLVIDMHIGQIAYHYDVLFLPVRFARQLTFNCRFVKGPVQPMSFEVMKIFEAQGFKLKKVMIKEQHNCKATGYCKTNNVKYNFLLLTHEYSFVFRK